MTMPPLRRDNEIPPPGPELEIKRVPSAGVMEVICLSTIVNGFWVHWNLAKERTTPCMDPRETCVGCKAQWPLRWKGYLHCWDVAGKGDFFLEVTPLVAKFLKEGLGLPDVLRGIHFKISRGKGRTARLKVEILRLADGINLYKLPREVDPQMSLAKVMGYKPGNPDNNAPRG